MSVPEMRRLLGLKKTDSYWLVHRNFFQTYIVNGQMRVDIASFEKWYANQVKHKKVNGEEPGAELMKSSYSFRDAANLLGIHSSNLYEIWRDQNLKTITVDFTKRIPIEVFEEWYEHQIMYQKVGRMPTITDLEKDYIRLQEAAALAGVSEVAEGISGSYATQKEAEKRKKEIEYKQSLGTFVVPKCTRVKELVREYVRIYGHNE